MQVTGHLGFKQDLARCSLRATPFSSVCPCSVPHSSGNMLQNSASAPLRAPSTAGRQLRTNRSSRHMTPVVMAADKYKVAVTGAGGKTGKLVFQKLLERSDVFEAVAFVRSEKSADSLRSALGAPAATADIQLADIAANSTAAQLSQQLQGCYGLVIATSAVPVIKPFSLVTMMIKKLLRQEGAMPEFKWKEAGQNPEKVDWLGQKLQIDAAKAAGVKKVVLVSSMGGTQLDNRLNKLGEAEGGNILVWKRKAEQYLIDSGLDYTILHPGGLTDEKGGERELVVDVDDKLLERNPRSIPRADVAELAVQCVTLPQAKNRSIDVITKPPGEGTVTTDFAALLSDMPDNCDYSLPKVEASVAA